MTEWKQCLEPYIKYEVNENGEIRLIRTKINKKKRIDLNGYEVVSLLTSDNRVIVKKVHILVISAFKGDQSNMNLSVDHIDRNKTNNKLNNLRWASVTEQAFNRTFSKIKKGYGHKKVIQYDLYGNIIREFKNMYEINIILGIPKYSVSAVCNGRKKTTHGYVFKFKEEEHIDGEE